MQVNCWAGLRKMSVLMRCSHFGGTSQLILANKVRFFMTFFKHLSAYINLSRYFGRYDYKRL